MFTGRAQSSDCHNVGRFFKSVLTVEWGNAVQFKCKLVDLFSLLVYFIYGKVSPFCDRHADARQTLLSYKKKS